jgi:hypothetical protein
LPREAGDPHTVNRRLAGCWRSGEDSAVRRTPHTASTQIAE